MAKTRTNPRTQAAKNPHAIKHDREQVAQRDAFARSGAAGIHADQRTRKTGTYATNRVGSRSAQRATAIRNETR